MLNPANFFNRFWLMNITTQTINGISGIDDNTSLAQDFRCLPDQSFLRVFGMNPDEHNLGDSPGLVASEEFVEIALPFFGDDLIQLNLQLLFVARALRFVEHSERSWQMAF